MAKKQPCIKCSVQPRFYSQNKIALKELRETFVYMKIITRKGYWSQEKLAPL